MGYPPPGYPPAGAAPVSPFPSGAEAPSFNGSSPFPGAAAPVTSYPPPSYSFPPGVSESGMGLASAISGLKFSYSPQSGDYYSEQSRNAGRWEQFPVTLHLSFPEDMSDKDKTAVKSAVTLWQKYLDISLVDRPDLAQIELTWVTDLADDDELGETKLIRNHVDPMGRNILDKVIIRMQDPSQHANVVPNALKSAVMHQLGHALGINSHSDNGKDLMAEPSYKRVRNKIVQKAVRSLASKTIGQILDLPSYDSDSEKKSVVYPPVEKISKRDLNTLFRLYN